MTILFIYFKYFSEYMRNIGNRLLVSSWYIVQRFLNSWFFVVILIHMWYAWIGRVWCTCTNRRWRCTATSSPQTAWSPAGGFCSWRTTAWYLTACTPAGTVATTTPDTAVRVKKRAYIQHAILLGIHLAYNGLLSSNNQSFNAHSYDFGVWTVDCSCNHRI